MERVKRDLEAAPQHGYSSANPWSAVFFAATKDMEFWSKEVVIPGTLLLARGNKPGSPGKGATLPIPDPPLLLGRAAQPRRRRSIREKICRFGTQPIRSTPRIERALRFAGTTTLASVDQTNLKESAQTRGLISATSAWGHTPHTNALGPKTEEIRRARPIGRCPRL